MSVVNWVNWAEDGTLNRLQTTRRVPVPRPGISRGERDGWCLHGSTFGSGSIESVYIRTGLRSTTVYPMPRDDETLAIWLLPVASLSRTIGATKACRDQPRKPFY